MGLLMMNLVQYIQKGLQVDKFFLSTRYLPPEGLIYLISAAPVTGSSWQSVLSDKSTQEEFEIFNMCFSGMPSINEDARVIFRRDNVIYCTDGQTWV